jgi:hypothetical protein
VSGASAGGTGGCDGGNCCLTAIAAFDAAPNAPCKVLCNLPDALLEDGASAGIDCKGGGTIAMDGWLVTACLGVDFGAPLTLDPIILTAKSAHAACPGGTACTQCDTGDVLYVFVGTTMGSYYNVYADVVTSSLAHISIPNSKPTRFVVVCRGESGDFRDDIMVDAVRAGACQ